MNFLKATTTDYKTELFNLDHILNIVPKENGTTKILMGAGLAWHVYTDSIEPIENTNEFFKAIWTANV